MSRSKVLAGVLAGLATGMFVFPAAAQVKPASEKADRAAAYYHYSLGHLYAELAGAYGNRADYLNKAIENYRLAMKADPGASYVSEELSDLYIQTNRLREAEADAEELLKSNPNDLNARRILARIYTRRISDSQNRIDESMLKKAIEQYEKIADKAPGDVDSLLMLGRLNKVAQNSVEAEKAYKKVLAADPNNEDGLTGLAMVYNDLGDTKSAADLLRKAAEKNPNPRSLTTLAKTYEEMHDYGLAAETLKKAIDLTPNSNPELRKALAQNLLMSEQYDEAEKQFQALVSEDPKDVGLWLRLSQIYRQKRDFAKAREAGDKALELDPGNLEFRYNEVSLLEAEGKLNDAIARLKEILDSTSKRNYSPQEKSNRALLLERIGMLYRSAEQYPAAVDSFRQIGDLDTEMAPRVSAQVIDTYRQARDFTKALQEADAAAKKYPSDRVVRVTRASLLADLGKVDQAVSETKKMLDGKNDREVYLQLAQIFEKGKKFEEMAKAIDAADNLSTTKEDKETVYFMRGAMYEKIKKFEQAEAEFQRVLKVNPSSAAALNYLGYMLADRNVRLQEALQMITKAVEQEPTNGAYLDSLGWVYYRLNRFDEAENQLKRSLDRVSRDPAVHDHLGDVYFSQGKVKEAIAQWQVSLKEWDLSAPADQEPAEIAKVQKKLETAKVREAREGAPKNNHQ